MKSKYLLLLLAIIQEFGLIRSVDPWTWQCIGETKSEAECRRFKKTEPPTEGSMSIEKCKLTCGDAGSLMPKPSFSLLGNETIAFLPSQIVHNNVQCEPNICPLLMQAVTFMIDTLNKYHPDYSETSAYWLGPWLSEVEKQQLVINIHVTGTEEYLTLTTDESYSLDVSTSGNTTNAIITAKTFFGARHALETLSQLIEFDEENRSLQIVSEATINDAPAFPHRGFIIDTSRNFISIKHLKTVLDGMSYNKLNTFHWHLTDSHSFPLYLDTLPKMATYGAYNQRHIYRPDEIRDLVSYARVRGIKIIPEIDAPAHVGHGWEWGEEDGLGKLVVCLNKQPWRSYCLEPPCGQLNLANENIYKVLGMLYEELLQLFSPVEYFHFGGDEIHLNCWNTSTEMTEMMTRNGLGLEEADYHAQWNIFQERARQLLTKANNGTEIPGVLWTSELTRGETADKFIDKNKYIIQIWTRNNDSRISEMLQKGYRVIFSNFDAFYFDCGSASWVSKGDNWCSPYKGWQVVYDNDIHGIALNLTGTSGYNNQILGGEGAVWTEQIDEHSLDAKLWARGAALGERLWTNPKTDFSKAINRMLHHRFRLVRRGLQAERMQPEWCRQNGGSQCFLADWKPSQ